jgi:hypothetical protein
MLNLYDELKHAKKLAQVELWWKIYTGDSADDADNERLLEVVRNIATERGYKYAYIEAYRGEPTRIFIECSSDELKQIVAEAKPRARKAKRGRI